MSVPAESRDRGAAQFHKLDDSEPSRNLRQRPDQILGAEFFERRPILLVEALGPACGQKAGVALLGLPEQFVRGKARCDQKGNDGADRGSGYGLKLDSSGLD